MAVLVFANGIIENGDWIRPYIERAVSIIAADGGGHHLARLGIRPDVVVGDMDSLDGEVLKVWRAAGSAVFIHSAEKDETDLELALLYAVRHYQDEIKIFGALGGRLDQMMANILLLAHPAFLGRRLELIEPGQRAWLVVDRTEVAGTVGDLVSLIPLRGDVLVGRTGGLKWPLENEVLQFGPARGISNVMLAERAVVEIKKGVVLCIHMTG